MQEQAHFLQVHGQEGSLLPDACQDSSGSTRSFLKPQRSANKNMYSKTHGLHLSVVHETRVLCFEILLHNQKYRCTKRKQKIFKNTNKH